jgi:hypothetical protein
MNFPICVAWFSSWLFCFTAIVSWMQHRHLTGEIRYWRSQYARVLAQNDQLYSKLLEREAQP